MSSKQRLKAWLRVTYLDRWITLFVGLLVLLTMIAAVRTLVEPALSWADYVRLWLIPTVVIALLYGAFRARNFHPLYGKSYGEWLHTQPWVYPQPLPLGPWHFVWQDLVFVTLLSVAGIIGGYAFPMHFSTSPTSCVCYVVAAFLVGYSLVVAYIAISSSEKYGGFGMPIVYASLAWLSAYPAAIMGLLVVGALLAHFSARRLLVHFHDVLRWRFSGSYSYHLGPMVDLGWPLDALLKPNSRSPYFSLEATVLVSVTVAWCIASISHLIYLHDPSRQLVAAHYQDFALFLSWYLLVFAVICALVRLQKYWFSTNPPFTVMGRFATGRLLIPRYDYVFLSPVAAVLVGWKVPAIMCHFESPIEFIVGATTLLVSLIILGVGPNFYEWHLAGHHQLVFRKKLAKNHVSTQ